MLACCISRSTLLHNLVRTLFKSPMVRLEILLDWFKYKNRLATSPTLKSLPFPSAKTVVQCTSAGQFTGPRIIGELLQLKRKSQAKSFHRVTSDTQQLIEATLLVAASSDVSRSEVRNLFLVERAMKASCFRLFFHESHAIGNWCPDTESMRKIAALIR